MDYKIKLDNMLNQENGILLESEAINAGISKYRFLEYVRMNNLERIAPGIYMSEDALEDGMYILQRRYAQAIFLMNLLFIC